MSNFSKSDFSKDKLYEIYGKFLPMFTELANEAIKNGVDLTLDVDTRGKIEITSKEWDYSNDNLRLLRKHYIKQTRDSVADGSESYKFDK